MRWNRCLLLGAMAMLVPALAGCEAGFNAPTQEFHQSSAGVSIVHNGISLNNLFVLGPPIGAELPAGGQAGFFLAMQAQNGDRLLSVSAPGSASSVKLADGPVDLPAQTPVNLSGPVPAIVLSGLINPLSGGETIQLTLVFAQAGAVTLGVPVEPNSFDYATYSPPPIPAPTAQPTGSASAGAGAPGSASASPSASPSTTP
jgi:copper(I)-binding protein